MSNALNELRNKTHVGYICVSHYERFFMMLKPTHAHVIFDGKIVCEGDYSLVEKIDQEGYDWLSQELGVMPSHDREPLVYSLGFCAHKQKR